MRRLGAALAAVVLLSLAGCSDDDSPASEDDPTPAGILDASDMPFDEPRESALTKPDPLTQLTRSCVGIEQDVLYDADWTVEARKFFDDDQWSITTAVLTPPAGATGDGLEQVRAQSTSCIAAEKDATVKPLTLGNGVYAYEVIDAPGGGFDSARAYVALDGGALAQVSVQEMPGDQVASRVLQDLLDELD
jgi:hypothetical protein